MKPAQFLIVCCCLIILISCGGNASKKDEAAETSVTAHNNPDGIYLEGMYATSTGVPKQQYHLDNIFDNDTTTYWRTTKGAGPDEGFVLYFGSKQYISEIQMLPVADTTMLAKIKIVSVYGDGHRLGEFNLADPIKIDKELTSLFVKIGDTNKSTMQAISSENEENEMSLEEFDPNYAVGISEIKIFNAEGQMEILPPVLVDGSIAASSVLEPANAYSPEQLFDSRKEFVWAEGAKGNGENETLTFRFNDDQSITSIKLWNGYQRSQKHFESNTRVKTFELASANGTKTKYTIADSMEPQVIALTEPLKGKSLQLTILEVYPGKDYKDLVLSEILFFDGNRPLKIKDDKTDEAVNSFIAKTKGSVLEDYIDRRLHNQTVNYAYTSNKSLILRSDKTFVLYDHTVTGDATKQEEKEVVADGNWEVVEQKSDYAKIRIFGKLFNQSETTEYYKGNSSTELIKIFQDNLHVTPTEVKGEKFIDAFYNKLPDAL